MTETIQHTNDWFGDEATQALCQTLVKQKLQQKRLTYCLRAGKSAQLKKMDDQSNRKSFMNQQNQHATNLEKAFGTITLSPFHWFAEQSSEA